MSDMAPLSRDHVHGSPAEGAPMVVLYAPLGSAAFAAAHAVLGQQSAQGTITYVYRPLWVASAKDARQTLQGYGVQLAIKNMEYKTMDDAAIKDLGGMDDLDGGAALDGAAEDDDEHGFYFGTLRARRPELNDTITTFKDMLAASLSSQDASSLKVCAPRPTPLPPHPLPSPLGPHPSALAPRPAPLAGQAVLSRLRATPLS